jgi:2-polyprenyl-6-methoxyphenol hydroxylase-like FAD-dependent oxidoreductase
MIDFWGVGYDVAERMDLLPILEADGYRLQELRLVDASGRRIGGFDARVFRTATHGRFLSLLRGDLALRLYELVEDRVDIIFGDTIGSLDEDDEGVHVRFERSLPQRFDLVVGADGLHSNVRALAFRNAAHVEHYLGYCTAAFTVNGYPHRDEGTYVSYAVPGRQAARYALRGGRTAFFFVFAQDAPPAFGHHDAEAQMALLRGAFRGAGWECDEILSSMVRADDFYFDAVAQTRMRTWSRGRVALVGDAAYCPSLLAGRGSAFAMAGALVLAHALKAHAGDHRAAFADYQRQFKPFVDRKQIAAERFGGWFAPRTPFRLRLRNLATNAMNTPVLGTFLMRRSFGDRFDLPADPTHA